MPKTAKFALLRTLDVSCKPILFEKLEGLVRRIHRDRRGAVLHLADHTAHLDGDGRAGRRMVGVYAQSEAGDPIGFLGWAWLEGQSWRALQAALYAAEPNPAVRAEAA